MKIKGNGKEISEIVVKRVGALEILKSFYDKLKISEIINKYAPTKSDISNGDLKYWSPIV